MNGKFITIEGIDGSGKTIQMNLLKDYLERQGYQVKTTEEPSKTIVGDLVKAVAKIDDKFFPEADALLFAADRIEHSKKIIEPALELGNIVLCERYTFSSYAYQSSQNLNLEWIKKINKYAVAPNLIIVLDIPPRVSRKRRMEILSYEEGVSWKFEKIEFLTKVREKYIELAKTNPNVVVIDGTKPVEEIHQEILNIVKNKFGL